MINVVANYFDSIHKDLKYYQILVHRRLLLNRIFHSKTNSNLKQFVFSAFFFYLTGKLKSLYLTIPSNV